MDPSSDALRRIVDRAGIPNLVEILATDLPGADFTTLMLHVMRERAARVTPSSLLRQYTHDRFVSSGAVPFARVRTAEDLLLGALPDGFEVLTLAPVAPLGTHSGIAGIPQHNVVSTARRSEVAADPTNVLAIEAALRRRVDLRADAPLRLAGLQRVVRAQRFEGAASFAHFQLLGLVSAGRDRGNRAFECEQAAEHLGFHVDALVAAGADHVRVELTDFTAESPTVVEAARAALAGHERVDIVDAPDRPGGRGYYLGFCFKTYAVFGPTTLEIGDGGFVDWTVKLTGSRKERCLISGLGVERIALAMHT